VRILITGADGFVGSSLLRRIPEHHQVVALARNASLLREHLTPKDNVTVREGDITDEECVRQVTKGVDCVVHLAGVKGTDRCQAQPSQALLANILGTHLLLHWARKHGSSRFIFSSSYWAYGFYPGQPMPLLEDMELRPNEIYGASKAISEREVMDSGQEYVILRLSNVYGYGAGIKYSGEVVSGFVERACRGQPLSLHNGGRQRLDFVHVDDVCDCICKFIEGSRPLRGAYNVGSGVPQSIADVADMVARVCETHFGKRVEVIHVPGPSGQSSLDRWVSIEKVKAVAGWHPTVSLPEGIAGLAREFHKTR
jgi:nucleoside-diphosphate-sugar epimerase